MEMLQAAQAAGPRELPFARVAEGAQGIAACAVYGREPEKRILVSITLGHSHCLAVQAVFTS